MEGMKLTLKIWRQKAAGDSGGFETHQVSDISPDMSFLEVLDVLNESIIRKGGNPVSFDYDCREGMCGMCGFMINGQAHGPEPGTTVCQLHMRHFKDGDIVVVEPFRARAFPVVKDLVVDRSVMDGIIAAGGYISASTGSVPDANATLVPKRISDRAMDAAECIGCGACVAACPNAAAMLFVGAKVSHLALLPQGQPERDTRVLSMVHAMDAAGFGNCTNEKECEAACPRRISVENIARMNREFIRAKLFSRSDP
jgi:succinate dehydrogenase / fumarate reductase iron-sulfur subunit